MQEDIIVTRVNELEAWAHKTLKNITTFLVLSLLFLGSLTTISVMNTRNKQTFHPENRIEKLESDVNKKHEEVSSALNQIESRFKQTESQVHRQGINLGNRLKPYPFKITGDLPIKLYANIDSRSFIENPRELNKYLTVGISFAFYSNNTQVPIASINRSFITAKIMFDGAKGYYYLTKYADFFADKDISINNNHETVRVGLGNFYKIVSSIQSRLPIQNKSRSQQDPHNSNISRGIVQSETEDFSAPPRQAQNGSPINDRGGHTTEDTITLIDSNPSLIDSNRRAFIESTKKLPTFEEFLEESIYVRCDISDFIFIKIS